jgi:hypothetical protein
VEEGKGTCILPNLDHSPSCNSSSGIPSLPPWQQQSAANPHAREEGEGWNITPSWKTDGINLAWEEVVHLDKVPLDVVPLKEVVHLDKVPLDEVPLEEEMSLEEVAPLE